jgi:Zn-dependent peptidase ImmA (M78 family)
VSEYVPLLDVWITQEKMPMRVRAFCKRLAEVNCIVLNQDLSDEKKYEAVEHELQHLANNDLDSSVGVDQIEEHLK